MGGKGEVVEYIRSLVYSFWFYILGFKRKIHFLNGLKKKLKTCLVLKGVGIGNLMTVNW